MMRRAVPHVALLALIVGLALVSRQTLRVIARPASAEAKKLEAADRVLAYSVVSDRGPRFLLDGGRLRLKLSSLAVVRPTGGYDPALELSYGLQLTVRLGERELWRDEVWLASRQSKDGWDGEQWAHEGAWSPEGLQLADERLTIIDLPEVPVDSVLEIRSLGAVSEVELRVFQAAPRDAAQRERTGLRWDDERKAELLQSSTYVPWSLLGPDEKRARLERRWVRLPALGDEGDDFTTRALFVTEFRLPQARIDTGGFLVSSDHAAVVNVLGPTRVTVAPLQPVAFRIDTIGKTQTTSTSPGGPRSLELGDGPHSIVVSTTATAEVAFAIAGDQDRWVIPAEQRAATPIDRLVPDRVRIPMTMIGTTATATVPVRKLDDGLLGRVLRVDARRWLGADAGTSSTITVVFRAADSREVGRDSITITGTTAPLERLGWMGTLSKVTEPTTFRVVAPDDAVRLELSADRDVAVRLYRWLPGDQGLAPPYRELVVDGLAWRYAPLEQRAWYPMAPHNHDVLTAGGRLAELEAQVRLDAVAGDRQWPALGAPTAEPPDDPRYQTLELRGPEQQRGRELLEADRAREAIRDWAPGTLSELRPGEPRKLEFRAELAARPRISWAVPIDLVGKTAVVSIAGTQRSITLFSRFGSAELPRVPPGAHPVTVTAPAGAQLWINRPPTGDVWGIYRDRTLYAIGRRPLRVSITQVAGERLHLYAIFYALPATPPPRVRLTVDGGRPDRRVGVVTRLTTAEVITELPPSLGPHAARLIDLGGRSAGTPRVVHLGLLDDLQPGLRELEAEVLGGGRLWLRLIVSRRGPGDHPRSGVDDGQ